MSLDKKVITFGVFDFFHLGHLRMFENAKSHGSFLIVAVQDGDYIRKYKPNAEIFYSTEQRIDLVKALRVVDEVITYENVDVTIQNVDFDVFAIGEDQTHSGFQRALHWCRVNNKEIVRIQRTQGICSSNIKTIIENLR